MTTASPESAAQSRARSPYTCTPAHLRLASTGTGALALAAYLVTLAPSVSFIDAGELATVAHTFGIAHPTGYPLFTMIAGLWARLPLGDGIVRLNVFAAVMCATAAALLVPLFWTLLGLADPRRGAVKGKGSKGSETPVKAQKGAQRGPHRADPRAALPDAVRLGPAVAGALAAAFSRTFWGTAVAIEVYSLHLALVAAVLLLFVRAELDAGIDARTRTRRRMLFALVLGLAFTNHMTTILLAPALLTVFFMSNGFRADAWKSVARMVPPFAAGLLPYLYLPLRASAEPALAWGWPATWERFIWHVSGKQYRTWIFSSTEAARRQFEYFLGAFPVEFAYVLLVFAVIGLVFAFRRHRRTGWMLALLFTGCVLYSINYDIHDIDSYFLLAYLAAAGMAAFGFAWVAGKVASYGTAAQVATLAVPVALVAALSFGEVNESGNHLVEDYTRNMLTTLAPNALVLSYQWDYWVSASLYYQIVERMRPDVVVIDKELLRRSWYLMQIRRNHPEIYRRSQAEIESFIEQLVLFEHDQPYDGEQIEARYNRMIESFFAHNEDRPLYVTIELERTFASSYVRVPEGLAFRLYHPEAVPPADAPVNDTFTYRPFDRPGRLEDGIRSMYAAMLTNRGVWLNQAGLPQKAAAYFDRALAIDHGYQQAAELKQRARMLP